MSKDIKLAISDSIGVKITYDNAEVKISYVNQNKQYEKTFTQNDVKNFSTGNITNFYKICKEVFEKDENSLHTLTFDEHDDVTDIHIKYSGMFEFELDIAIPFVQTMLDSAVITVNSNNTELLAEISNIKLVLNGALGGIKQFSAEVVTLKNENALLKNEIVELKKSNNAIGSISTTDLQTVLIKVCGDIKKLEKFVFSEINEIKISENDKDEKIPIKCPTLSINFMDCLCCTVNKYTLYNGELNYVVSTNSKIKFNDNFKVVQCKDLTINVQCPTNDARLQNLPLSVETLTVVSKVDFVDFAFLTTIDFSNIKKLFFHNISRSHNFDLVIKHANVPTFGVSNSENFIKEFDLAKFGYQFKENIKINQDYMPQIISIFIKTSNTI